MWRILGEACIIDADSASLTGIRITAMEETIRIMDIILKLKEELKVEKWQVEAAVKRRYAAQCFGGDHHEPGGLSGYFKKSYPD